MSSTILTRLRVRREAAQKVPHTHGENLLKLLARVAHDGYGLTVWQWAKIAPPVGTHSPGSMHYMTYTDGVGKAWDAYGSGWAMASFSLWVRHHAHSVTEGIHRPGLSIKNGHDVPASFWGDVTWSAHGNHVHIGVA